MYTCDIVSSIHSRWLWGCILCWKHYCSQIVLPSATHLHTMSSDDQPMPTNVYTLPPAIESMRAVIGPDQIHARLRELATMMARDAMMPFIRDQIEKNYCGTDILQIDMCSFEGHTSFHLAAKYVVAWLERMGWSAHVTQCQSVKNPSVRYFLCLDTDYSNGTIDEIAPTATSPAKSGKE